MLKRIKQGMDPYPRNAVSWEMTEKANSLYNPYFGIPTHRQPMKSGYGKRPYQVVKNMTLAALKSSMRSSRALRRYRKGSGRQGLNRRGVASQETGFVDLASANYELSTTGSITLISTVAQGASVNQRVGKKILYKGLQIRGDLVAGSTGTVSDAAYIIVYDKRPTGSLPAITDVLVSANSLAFNNDANSGRFRILKRVDQTFVGNSVTPTEKSAVTADDYLSLKGLSCVFKAAGTGAIGDIEEGALYLITVGNTATGTTSGNANLAFRTRFIDV